MARCGNCGTVLLWAGAKADGFKYCNDRCKVAGASQRIGVDLPFEVIGDAMLEIRNGACPRCGRGGPIDVHQAYFFWSLLILGGLRTEREVCCRWCGFKMKFMAFLGTSLCGWWGLPIGVIGTPIALVMNVVELARPSGSVPSRRLEKTVRSDFGSKIAVHQKLAAERAMADEQPYERWE